MRNVISAKPGIRSFKDLLDAGSSPAWQKRCIYGQILSYLKKFERIIVISLFGMLALTITLTTIELGWLIIKEIITPPLFIPEPNELLNMYGSC